jgi:hypothetical protein
MDEPPFSLAFVMVKESFAVPTILFYLAAMLTKTSVRATLSCTERVIFFDLQADRGCTMEAVNSC